MTSLLQEKNNDASPSPFLTNLLENAPPELKDALEAFLTNFKKTQGTFFDRWLGTVTWFNTQFDLWKFQQDKKKEDLAAPNRRQSKRITIEARLNYKIIWPEILNDTLIVKKEEKGMLVDISTQGIGFKSRYKIPSHSLVEIKISQKAFGTVFNFLVKIVRGDDVKGGWMYGGEISHVYCEQKNSSVQTQLEAIILEKILIACKIPARPTR